jgi:hypothetical protein
MPAFKSLRNRLRLTIAVAVLAFAVVASTSIVVQASTLICRSGCDGSGGETLWLSCGSSAGNYFALCPAGGGTCTVDQGLAQQEANDLCSNIQNLSQ